MVPQEITDQLGFYRLIMCSEKCSYLVLACPCPYRLKLLVPAPRGSAGEGRQYLAALLHTARLHHAFCAAGRSLAGRFESCQMVKLGQWLQKAVANDESSSSPLPFFPLQLTTSFWAFLTPPHSAAGLTSGAPQERVLFLQGTAP